MDTTKRALAALMVAAFTMPVSLVAAAAPADGHGSYVVAKSHHRLRHAAEIVGGAAVVHHVYKKHKEKKAIRREIRRERQMEPNRP